MGRNQRALSFPRMSRSKLLSRRRQGAPRGTRRHACLRNFSRRSPTLRFSRVTSGPDVSRAGGQAKEVARGLQARVACSRSCHAGADAASPDVTAGFAGSPEPEGVAALARWRLQRLNGWREALADAAAGTLPSDAETGKLAAGLCDIVVRDAAVIAMVPGRLEVAQALCEDPTTPGVREALSVMIAAGEGGAAARAQVSALVALTEHVASLCDEGVAPALTLAGLALWWSGDDSSCRARHCVRARGPTGLSFGGTRGVRSRRPHAARLDCRRIVRISD